MPIVILGPPRSGLGLAAELIQRRGIHLANRSLGSFLERGGARPSLDERILAALGGGWDDPPGAATGWETTGRVAGLLAEAERRAAELATWEPWAWYHPAATFTLPLWRRAIPDLATIVVVRNPLEVMESLRSSCGCSMPSALRIVRLYLTSLARQARTGRIVVTHHGALSSDPEREADRILGRLGIEREGDAAGDAGRASRPRSGVPRFTLRDLSRCGMPDDIVASYAALCAEARFADHGDGVEAEAPAGVLDELAVAIAAAEASSAVGNLLESLRGDIASRDEALQDSLDEIRFHLSHVPVPAARQVYRNVVRRCRGLVRECVPQDATLLVVSKGDDDLLAHRGIASWHFPRDPRGMFAGWHPAGDVAAIAHLEVLRSGGATHLLVPETYDWWLTSYPGFREHLETRHRLVERRAGAGKLFELLARPERRPEGGSPEEVVRRVSAALGRPAQVLDLGGGSAGADLFGDAIRFTAEPPCDGMPLPHVDDSVDVVATAGGDRWVTAEARRVASLAVVDVTGSAPVEWIAPLPATRLPSASIVIPVWNNWPVTRGCLVALRGTLPESSAIEIIVVDDASTDETGRELAAWSAVEPRLRILRNAANVGFVGSCNAAAAAATGDVLVFLNNDTVPLPGWFEALLRSFADLPGAGAVGGKMLFPDGRLQEAGGVIFADGSACHFGRGEADAAAPPFDLPRPVDYVSGAMLATPRPLFAEMGGFDPAFAPGYYEDTDYCFRLRERGRGVWFQPAAMAVHFEGATAGTDESAGMKRYQAINRERFMLRHAEALEWQPDPIPHPFGAGWTALVRRGRGLPR